MRPFSFSILIPVSVAALVGCTTRVSASGEAADAEASSTASAVVVIEGSSTGAEGARSDAVARFVRARGGAVDDEALRMAGAVVDFPVMGACAPLASARAAAPARAIALLDVGAVTLLVGSGAVGAGDPPTTLLPRQVPDVADLVSGVVYSARGQGLPSRGAYTLRVEGSADLEVAPFAVNATSPGEPNDVRVAGDDGRAGAVALAPNAAVELTWEPGSGEDVIYVDVSASSAAPATRCLLADAGRALVPAVAFGAIEDGTLAVHRMHREAFRARGVDPGEVRFDFARIVPFTRPVVTVQGRR